MRVHHRLLNSMVHFYHQHHPKNEEEKCCFFSSDFTREDRMATKKSSLGSNSLGYWIITQFTSPSQLSSVLRALLVIHTHTVIFPQFGEQSMPGNREWAVLDLVTRFNNLPPAKSSTNTHQSSPHSFLNLLHSFFEGSLYSTDMSP
jgi:hypothetical protein